MSSPGVITINFDSTLPNSNKIYNSIEEEKQYICRPDLENKTEGGSTKLEYTVTNDEPETEQESKTYLNNLMRFVQTDNFDKLCSKWEKKSGYSKRKVAETFFQRCLGTIGDFTCIGCDTFESVVHKFISIVGNILKLAVSIITKLAKAAFRVITLNYTRG